MENRIKVLFLPRWYPHRYDPMPGLFISQLAESLVIDCDVAVLYAYADDACPVHREIEVSEENGVHVVRVYYKTSNSETPGVAALQNGLRFISAYREGFRFLRGFQPDLVHVHVLTRHGALAYFRKLLQKTPYIISEHWSRYLTGSVSYRGAVRKMITKLLVHKAGGVITVSEQLKEAMISHRLVNRNFHVIPNPVDFALFVPSANKNIQARKKIVHVSCFEDRSKNISGLLQILSRMSSTRNDFECNFVGEGPDFEQMKKYAAELHLNEDIVKFEGLRTGKELVYSISSADLMVLSSHFETFATVVVEALACGVPVLATAVGIVPEIINEKNGIMVPPSDEQALQEGLNNMLDNCRSYDKIQIRSTVINTFAKENVAKQVMEVYRSVLGFKSKV